MKVCFVVNLPSQSKTGPDLEIVGGAELQCYLIGKQLVLKGWNVAYITPKPITLSEKTFHAYYAKTILPGDGVLARYSSAPSLFTLLKEINPDIVVTTYNGSLSGFVALYCLLYRKKFLYRAASILDADLTFGKNTGWNDLGFLSRRLHVFAVKRADAIATNAQYVAAAFKRRLPRKRIVVIRNGLPIESVQKSNASIVVWIGRFEKVKNPELFVRLARELPKIRFVMGGYGRLYEKCAKQAREVPNLRLIGTVDQGAKRKLLGAALAFVNTSFSEGFPNTLIEAGIYGVPSLSFVDPDEVICINSLGFHVRSFSELVDKTRLLAADSDLRKEIGINMRRFVERNHRIENTVSEYTKVLTSLLVSR